MLEFQIRQKEKQRLSDENIPYRKRLYDKSAVLQARHDLLEE